MHTLVAVCEKQPRELPRDGVLGKRRDPRPRCLVIGFRWGGCVCKETGRDVSRLAPLMEREMHLGAHEGHVGPEEHVPNELRAYSHKIWRVNGEQRLYSS